MQLKESGEMYLETIYILNRKTGFVRSIDVCEYMGYSKPSVSRAVGLLKEGGYLTVSKDGALNLTELGQEIEEKMEVQLTRMEREELVYQFLKKKLDEGLRRGQAIAETQKKFSICHPQTVYNIEKRVLKRKEDGNG